MTLSPLTSGLRDRARFVLRCFLTGVDSVGAFSNHNRVVGLTTVLAACGISLAPAAFGVGSGTLMSVLLAAAIITLVTLNGAYIGFGQTDDESRSGEPSDDEILAGLSPHTKAILSGWGKGLAQGDVVTRMFAASTIGELKKYALVEITHVPVPASPPIGAHVNAYMTLTDRGHRIFAKVKGYKAPPELGKAAE